MIESLAYASCYVYSPAGKGRVCEHSRMLRTLLKEGDARFMLKYALRVHQQIEPWEKLAGFFRSDDLLVPVPGSSPIRRGAWAAADLAFALAHEGMGGTVWQGLRRVLAVPKSATAAPGGRPTVSRHYHSFCMERPSVVPGGVVLIDDVVTKGRTLLAAAVRVRETLPGARVRAFALLRTMGMIANIDHLLDPCTGEIRWRFGDAQRSP
jgi:predicted amidophosphoribosyltransferase